MNQQIKSFQHIQTEASGRICLFGDHQDYLGLPVIACAINRSIKLNAIENDTNELRIDKPDIGQRRIIDIDTLREPVTEGDHLLAAVLVLKKYNCIPDRGFDITISGNVAINSGISSSSAVMLAWVKFLVIAYGCSESFTNEFLSEIAHKAEVTLHGAPGGKMDQYTIGLGGIIYLETGGNNHYERLNVQIPDLIVAESGIPKDTTGVLRELQEKVLSSIRYVERKFPNFNLKATEVQDFPKFKETLPNELAIYLEAALLNHSITQKALAEFRKSNSDIEYLGRLMNEHHHVLKEYLKISVPLIDDIVNVALKMGAWGAKIVGSGRGGCVAILSKESRQKKIIDALIQTGAKDAYPVRVGQGVRAITKK